MQKIMNWVVAALLGLFAPTLFALGLGGATVNSYLGQALDVRVEVISHSAEELQSMTVGLAKADDFEFLGLSRSAITVPLVFELVSDTNQPHIRITSTLKVTDPVIQVLLEVAWAKGRMLREYTLFLDPPTIASRAPRVVTTAVPRPVATEQRFEVDKPKQPPTFPEVVDAAVQEPETEVSPTPEIAAGSSESVENEVYGPVVRRETLWSIARDWSEGSGYSVNQAMLALQRNNPEAFNHGNINSLKRGAILRLPPFSEIDELSSSEARLEAKRQQAEFRISRGESVVEVPELTDQGVYQETVIEAPEQVESTATDAHLEIVPPADEEDLGLQPVAQVAEPAAALGPDQRSLQEDLLRTEEELVNVQQENSYLNERIQALEAELQAQAEAPVSVADTDLAALESGLAEQRLSDQPATPIALTPGGEDEPWYTGQTVWLIGIALLMIALLIWVLRRRSLTRSTVATPAPVSDPEVEVITPEPVEEYQQDDAATVSTDPEVRLDLARAYLSMGDKEAARSMLEEVMKNGNDEQRAEAQQMADEL